MISKSSSAFGILFRSPRPDSLKQTNANNEVQHSIVIISDAGRDARQRPQRTRGGPKPHGPYLFHSLYAYNPYQNQTTKPFDSAP